MEETSTEKVNWDTLGRDIKPIEAKMEEGDFLRYDELEGSTRYDKLKLLPLVHCDTIRITERLKKWGDEELS